MDAKEEIAKVRKARKRAIAGIAKDKIAKLHYNILVQTGHTGAKGSVLLTYE